MRAALLACALACAACSPPERQATPPEAAPALSPDGYGPIRIGMTPEEASAALGRDLLANGKAEPQVCETYALAPGAEPEGLRFLARDGRIASIADHGSPGVRTPEGVGVGATAAAVRAAYPGALEEPAKYDPPRRVH